MSSSTPPPPDDDPTRRSGDESEHTRRLDPADPAATSQRPALEYEQTDDRWSYAGQDRDQPPPPPGQVAHGNEAAAPRRGRDAMLVIAGLVAGLLLTLVAVALGTSDPDVAPDAASQEQVEELEAQLAERDARIEELEAQLDEAEAAAGEREEDVQAQLDALDERAAVLDDRVEELDERQQRLDEREAELDRREQQLQEREDAQQDPDTDDGAGDEPTDGQDGDGGIDVPEVDTEELETTLDRFLDRLRDLLGG